MTGQEDARRADTDSWIEVAGPTAALAEQIARTAFVPKGFQGQPFAVMAAILSGREMGLGPMASLRGMHVVEGKPALTADMLAARVIAAGHRVTWEESTDTRCTVLIERADRLSEARVTWTIADAQRAGLAGKGPWRQYPRRMLQHRTLSEAAAMACPDVMLGLDVSDDVATAPPEPARVVQVAQLPTQTPEPPQRAPQPPPLTPERPVVDVTDAEVVDEPAVVEALPAEDLVTGPQMRKIGALLGEMERLDGRKLDRDERRGLIAAMAGHPDPDSLQSAKELTKSQASAAIERLTEAVAEVVDAAPDPQDN